VVRKRQEGQALVELAFTSVILILILLGTVDFARAYQFDTALHEAARVGARHAALFDAENNINPFLCDQTLAGQCPPAGLTTYPGNQGIKEMVDASLQGSGLPASSWPTNRVCPGSATNAYNPPYDSSFYPTTVNTPWLYICYDTEASNPASGQETAGYGGAQAAAPSCSSTCGGFDLEVVILMKFGLVVGSGPFGPSVPMSGYQHIRVQGS
jgi:hypothetical protein